MTKALVTSEDAVCWSPSPTNSTGRLERVNGPTGLRRSLSEPPCMRFFIRSSFARSGGRRPRRTTRVVGAALAVALVMPLVSGPRPARGADQPELASTIATTRARVRKALGALPGIVAAVERRSGVPGMAVAVVYDDKIVFEHAYGVRRVGTNEPTDVNTVFQLASVSKSLASAVVAGVVGSGRVRWNDPLAKYLPGFTLSDPYVGSHVTIADMFAHRSGLPDHAGDLLEDLGYSRTQIIDRLRYEPLQPFRASYNYTNFGLTAAAQAVADAVRVRWSELSQRVLYRPLGMTRTTSSHRAFERFKDRATLHVRRNGRWVPSSREPQAQSPAGGASSTVGDLAKWMMLEMDLGTFHGKRIVGREALLATQQPHIVSRPSREPFGRASFYGYGMGVSYDDAGRLHLSHSGAFSNGAATTFDMLPSARLGIVVLTNGEPSGVPEAIARTFYDDVEFGKPTQDWYAFYSKIFAQATAERGELVGKKPPVHPQPAMPLDTYAGTYHNDYYGSATVRVTPEGLQLSLGPKHVAFRLRHWNGNEFAFTTTGENATGPSAVTFVPVSAGTGTDMTIEFFNENGLGTFLRRAPK